jgi:tRNA threonylcarbamoyladenosine biosynthesis protein TsaE
LRFRSRSTDATRDAARRLGIAIGAIGDTRAVGFVVGLVGPLGAGKTEWVKGLAVGLGADASLVTSPTFVIATEYPGPRPLAHVDFYRLESEAELESTGFVDLLEPGQIVAVEWCDRFPHALPVDHIEVCIARAADDPEAVREIDMTAFGTIAEQVLQRFEREMKDQEERAPWR